MRVRRRLLWRREGGAALLTVESRDGRNVTVEGVSGETAAEAVRLPDGRLSMIFPSGRQLTGRTVERSNGRVEAWVRGRRARIDLGDPLRSRASEAVPEAGGPIEVRAQIPGRVVEVRVAVGDAVVPGSTLLVLEAMKMQNEIRAESPARVVAIDCSAGQAVEAGTVLVRLEGESVS